MGITGWHFLSRIWVALVIVSGILAWVYRKSTNAKRRLLSAYIFKMFALGLTLIFLYLLFHEGGHAVASSLFGGKGFATSDFWGIHGRPRAGGMNQNFEPWQKAVTSFAGTGDSDTGRVGVVSMVAFPAGSKVPRALSFKGLISVCYQLYAGFSIHSALLHRCSGFLVMVIGEAS